jgi:transposase
MIRISLNESEREALTRLRLERSSNAGERAYYVLLADSGKSAPEIARHLKRNIITIRLWLNRYMEAGISGLMNQPPPGRPAKKTPAIERHLQEMLIKSPQDYGYQESGWQINIVRDWLQRQGIQACDNTIAKVLDKLDYVYKRFSKTMPSNAPSPAEKKEKVGEIIDKIKQNKPEELEILFADESHFSNQPYVCRGWFKRGEKKQ